MVHRIAVAVACLAFLAVAPSQAPLVAASVTSPLTVLAAGSPNVQQSTPVGPLPPAGVQLSAVTVSSSAWLRCEPFTVGAANATGFRVHAGGSTLPNFFSASAYDTAGSLVLHLTMATPTPVLIRMGWSAQALGSSTSGRTDIDIRNDGTIDHSVVVPASGAVAGGAEAGVLVGPAGVDVRIVHQGTGFWTGFGLAPSMSCNLDLVFAAGPAPLSPYGTGCMPLTWTRDAAGVATLRCPSPNGVPAVFVLGWNPQMVTLPFPPGCPLLTDIVVVDVVPAVAGQASYVLPNYALPPGAEIRIQAGRFEANGDVLTSNGLVSTGAN